MAVYQGARRRPSFGLPLVLRPGSSTAERPASRKRGPAAATAVRTGLGIHGRRFVGARIGLVLPSTQRVGLVLASIVIVFSGAFLWLTQSVRVAATNYDIVRLTSEHDRLDALRVDLGSELERLAGGPAVRQAAMANGLGQLGAPVIIPAR